MLKNKKGFTLIELLVAIALMISITVVAIVSITKIGEQNKKQAYELVKDQVKTAALEFFSANEYLFEGLENGSIGYITVTKLVEEGYLNSLTNPITGEKLNGCDYISATKTPNGYSYEFNTDNKKNCIYDNSLIVRANISESNEESDVVLSPIIKQALYCKNNNGDESEYYNNNWCSNEITIKLTDSSGNFLPEGLEVKDLKVGNTTGSSYSMDENYILTDSYNSSTQTGTTFAVTIGGTYIESNWKIDNIKPELVLIQKKYGDKEYVHIDLDNYTTEDEVNNATYKLSKDTAIKNWETKGKINSLYDYNGEWINGQVLVIPAATKMGLSGVEFDCTDTFNGSKFGDRNDKENDLYVRKTTETERKISCVAISGANLESEEKTATIKIDNTKPELVLIQKKYGDNEYVHIDIDNYKTEDEVNNATYKLSKDTAIKNWETKGKINSLYDYNGEWINGQVLVIPTVKKTGPSGVKFDCTDTFNGSKFGDRNDKENDLYVRKTTDTERKITCVAISGTNLESEEKTATIKIDKVIPTVDLIMKKKNDSDPLYPESNISGLSNYSNNEIYNGYVFTKTSYTSGPSGVTVTCSDTNYDYILRGTHGPYDNFATYRNVNREGVTTIRCTATSGAGISSSEITKTIKLERNLKMVLDEDKMESVTAKSNGNLAFNTSKGAKYYSSTDKMGCEGCSAIGAPNSAGNYVYMGTACKNVVDYYRYFMIYTPVNSGVITTHLEYGETEFENTLSYGKIFEDLSQAINRYACNFNNLGSNKYNWNCGSATGSGTPNLTRHYYKYTAKSGASSKWVVLFTRYSASCGY